MRKKLLVFSGHQMSDKFFALATPFQFGQKDPAGREASNPMANAGGGLCFNFAAPPLLFSTSMDGRGLLALYGKTWNAPFYCGIWGWFSSMDNMIEPKIAKKLHQVVLS